jgi:ferredoxin-NADP reductase
MENTAPTAMEDSPLATAVSFEEIPAVIRQLRWEADGVISVELVAVDGAPLPAWEPGAHIDITLPNRVMRQYSLCSDPNRLDTYRIAVVRERASRGGSEYIHSFLRIGQRVNISAPRNHFRLLGYPEYNFVAGGIGITPILAMVRYAERAGVPWRLFYTGKSLGQMSFVDELQEFGDRVRLIPRDTSPRLSLPEVLASSSSGSAIYSCGPQSMVDELVLMSETSTEVEIRTERFTPSAAKDYVNSSHTLTLARSDLTISVPVEKTFLAALSDAGIKVPTSCANGICGTCEVRVLSGIPEHRDDVLTGADRKRTDCMYVCVSRAKTESVILDL